MGDLTYLQRIAMYGEIGKLVSTYSKHEEDVLFMCFLSFALYDLDLFEDVKNTLCKFVEKDIVDKVSYYVRSCIVPYDIWGNKIISDIKWLLGEELPDNEYYLLRSIFCSYIIKVKDVSKYACHYLLNKVLADDELAILHEDSFYLKNNIPSPVKVKVTKEGESKEDIDAYRKETGIFSISMMATNPLSFDEVPNIEQDSVASQEEDKDTPTDNIDTYMHLRESFSNVKEGTYFLVEKKNINTGERISVRRFNDIEEVILYLQNVSAMDSTLNDTCQFIVTEVTTDV